MNYPKKAFLIFVSFLLGLSAVLALAFSAPVILIVGLAFAIGAAFGRISNTLANVFARSMGKMLSSPFFLKLTAKITQTDLVLASSYNGSESGGREIRYENFALSSTLEALKRSGRPVFEFDVDAATINQFIDAAGYSKNYPNYYKNDSHFLGHKIFQHAITLQLMPVDDGQVWIDIAASTSPFSEILMRMYQVIVYKQDLVYPKGIHGLTLGGNAEDLPLEDASVDRICLHCSFEHFEGGSDTGFIRETARVLKPGGICCIIPIYLCDRPQILSNPRYWLERGVPGEEGIPTVAARRYWESHGRFYNGQRLENRVLNPADKSGLHSEILYVTPPPEFDYPAFAILRLTRPKETC